MVCLSSWMKLLTSLMPPYLFLTMIRGLFHIVSSSNFITLSSTVLIVRSQLHLSSLHEHWRRLLWGTGARAPVACACIINLTISIYIYLQLAVVVESGTSHIFHMRLYTYTQFSFPVYYIYVEMYVISH